MTNTKLQLTEFQIEKLRNVVNVGQSSAYQILTMPGIQLGTLGRIVGTDPVSSENEDLFEPVEVSTTGQSWLKKALGSLRSH